MSCQITSGLIKNVASTPFYLPIQNYISEFTIKNLTRSGVTAGGVAGSLTSTRIVEAQWTPYQANGTALIKQNGTVSGILAPLNNGVCAINGISLYDSSLPSVYPVVAIASYVPSSTATTLATVWTTSTAHGLSVGDNVRIYGLAAGSQQFNGLVQTVTAVGSTTTFTTLLNTNGGTTSTGSVQKVGNAYVQNSALYFPQNRVIAGITNAFPMVVTTLVPQNYQVGDVVTFTMPTAFGVPQLQATTGGLPFLATVTAANNAVGTQTVTFGGVDSTNFGVFGTYNAVSAGWPELYPLSFPYMVPNNEGNINNIVNVTPSPLPYGNQDVLSFATQNQGSRGILIGAGDGTNSSSTGGIIGTTVDVWYWEAKTSSQMFPSLPYSQ